MCGIVGYVGKKTNVLHLLIEDLQKLEYRGYDSAGIATLNEGHLFVEKHPGKIAILKEELKHKQIKESTVGIAHTRWATHGRPTQANAHPHVDCHQNIAVVHNGIIENFNNLKSLLIKKGHRFSSQTDTEVLAHLIEEELKGGRVVLEDAVCRALKKARGAYAIGVLSRWEPEKLVAARLGSPLIVGIGEKAHYIASDIPAISKHTSKVIYPKDGELITLTPTHWHITTLNKKPTQHKIHKVDWSYKDVAKDGYEKFMLKEIHEQPTVIEGILQRRLLSKGEICFEEMSLSAAFFKEVKRIFIVACGTAYHAAFFLKYFIEHLSAIPVEVDIGSELRYRRPKISKHVLVLTISQSGETADTLASLRAAKQKGCRVVSLCNVMGSTIERESDAVIYTHAGPEIGVASTKAYTAQMLTGILFALWLSQTRKEIPRQTLRKMISQLRSIPKKMKWVLKQEKECARIASKIAKAESALYLGRSFNYPSALEGALKNKEISYMHAEGTAAGEMKHGPIALIDSSFPVICICPKGESYEKMISNMKEVEARQGRIIAIATQGDTAVKNIAEEVLFIPQIQEELSPLLVALLLQLLAYTIAQAKGCDIDQPRNLAKSVTVE